MPLEYWIDEQIVAIIDRQQTARGFIRPVDRKGVYEWYKPVLKPKTVVRHDKTIPHPGPREIIDPDRMWGEELAWARCQPVWQLIVVLGCRVGLPLQEEEHQIQHGHLLRERGHVEKHLLDVSKELGDQMQ